MSKYNKSYYELNREKHNAKTRADYIKHREKRLASLREKRARRTDEQKEEDKTKMKEYYHKNKDRINQYSRERYAEQKVKIAKAEKLLAKEEKTDTLEELDKF
tara:strand:+ start:470 stop:778 length:309 start_codon:yes stop_codon:yes gene_type:complete